MSGLLTNIAGASGGPWLFAVTADPLFGTLNLATSTIVLRISDGGRGLVDLTIGDGLTLSGSTITARLSDERSAALGSGKFDYHLIITTTSGDVYVPEGAASGSLVLSGVLPSAP